MTASGRVKNTVGLVAPGVERVASRIRFHSRIVSGLCGCANAWLPNASVNPTTDSTRTASAIVLSNAALNMFASWPRVQRRGPFERTLLVTVLLVFGFPWELPGNAWPVARR